MATRLSTNRFAELVDQAIASLPEQFRRYMENVAVEIQPRPTARQRRQVGLSGGDGLFGLYEGVPLPDKSVSVPYELPQRIVIFQREIEDVCDDESDVVEQVRLTVLHEIGHHFGMDEEDLDELGY